MSKSDVQCQVGTTSYIYDCNSGNSTVGKSPSQNKLFQDDIFSL